MGGDYGLSWLEQHGTNPVSVVEQNGLWNWGTAPKGFAVYNGTLYPPGYGPQWFYPAIASDLAPVVINNTNSNYLSPALQSTYAPFTDPWLLAQMLGRPVTYINVPKSTLF